MGTPKYKLLLSICMCVILNLLLTTTIATLTYTASHCTNTTTYDPKLDSTFLTNLDALLFSLFNSLSNYYFTIEGFGTTDAINGLSSCRGDVIETVCDECLNAAVKQILIRCPNQKEAIIWYDVCFLRYTNNYFHFDKIVPGANLDDGNIATGVDLGRFNRSLHGLLNDLVTKAATSSQPKFASGKAVVTESMTVYGLMQCVDDLTNSQCETCLRKAIGTLPNGKQGARALLASCNVRYQLYPFFNLSTSVSVSPPSSGDSKLGHGTIAVVIVVLTVFLIILFLGCYYYKRRSEKKKRLMLMSMTDNFEDEIPTLESLQFNFTTLEAATNKFSLENKIGSGGFGLVYKGNLLDGRQIAVKKLSKNSGQGTIEFKNEIVLIAKLQHRNLVTLYGYCSEEQQKMLVYEYVPNKSLDYFLFDPNKGRVLSWHERYKIISGIARGIHYLHDQSRLKVIHRDLKPSNILLDEMMNPKISDFGMAKIIDIDQHQGNTIRIAGTYGYMSSEYAMHGHYSKKSDVFSFGVIIIEIISAKRNSLRLDSPDFDNLLSYAWKNWRDEKPLEVLDSDIEKSFSYSEVIRCIQIGLLCVQQNPDDRPTMERVVSYLSSVLVTLYGFCSEEQEKMLVYEYVANKSLDFFLFDPNKRRVLSWQERYRIISGIARGIHYLHDQSRLKVIHRDLKPSNILLDEMMNPKISDFGMAKMIDINQNQGNTKRIVGTYGYMSSEYAMHGNYSEKSDVFSFGVIILEIISAKRNARNLGSSDLNDLLSYAWKNWRDKKQLEVLDSDIEKSFCHSEVIKCIQIGLLCVQQNPYDRPTMERIVSYLSSASVELPLPQVIAMCLLYINTYNISLHNEN